MDGLPYFSPFFNSILFISELCAVCSGARFTIVQWKSNQGLILLDQKARTSSTDLPGFAMEKETKKKKLARIL